MTTDPLLPTDLEDFRRVIGLSALVIGDDGETYELDRDVDAVAEDVAIAAVSEEIGRVVSAREMADARYRAFRASMVGSILAGDPKLAEWKVRAQIESHPDFLVHKDKAASLDGSLATLQGYRTALEQRAHMMPTVG